MRLIVAALLLLCSAHAVAQAASPLQLERGNGPEPSTLDAHRCQEVSCGNMLRDPGWVGDVVDARNFLAAFGSDGRLNWSGYDQAAFRERLAKADAAKTETARNAWLHAAEQKLLNDQATIPLYFYTSKHLVRPELLGFEPNPLDRHASRWLRWRD